MAQGDRLAEPGKFWVTFADLFVPGGDEFTVEKDMNARSRPGPGQRALASLLEEAPQHVVGDSRDVVGVARGGQVAAPGARADREHGAAIRVRQVDDVGASICAWRSQLRSVCSLVPDSTASCASALLSAATAPPSA